MKTPTIRLTLIVVVSFLLLYVSGAIPETGKPPDPAAAKRGQALYIRYCVVCHAENGVGEPPIPWSIRRPDYYIAPALDDSQHAWHHSDEDLVNFIFSGSSRTNRMPAFQEALTEREAQDLVAYMKSLWGERALECQGPKHMACM